MKHLYALEFANPSLLVLSVHNDYILHIYTLILVYSLFSDVVLMPYTSARALLGMQIAVTHYVCLGMQIQRHMCKYFLRWPEKHKHAVLSV